MKTHASKLAALTAACVLAFGIAQPAHALFGVGDIVLDPTNLVQNTLSVRPFRVGPGFGRNDPGGVSPDGGRERAHLNSEGVAARGRLLTRDQERPGSLSGATRSENKQTGRMLAITARPALNTPPDAVRTPRARPDPWQWMSPATRASSAHP